METSEVKSALLTIRDQVDSLIDALEEGVAVSPATAPQAAAPSTKSVDTRTIRWGKKVGADFKASVLWIEDQIKLKADNLMPCMAFETGQTFSPSVKNAAGSSGTGLIQFMRATHDRMIQKYPQLAKLAPTHEDMAKLTAVQQMNFVYHYFKAYGNDLSRWSLDDTYMAILYPAAIGKSPDWVMPWEYGSLAYKQNSGLDLNKDHRITKAEACAGVRRMAQLGEDQRA